MTSHTPPPTLLACVGHGPNAETVIRSTARRAAESGAAWHAVHIETPRLRRRPEAERGLVLARLAQARALGATTSVLEAGDAAQALADYARSRQCGALLLGRSAAPRKLWQRSMLRRLAAYLPAAELTETGGRAQAADAALAAPDADLTRAQPAARAPFGIALAAGLLAAALLAPAVLVLDLGLWAVAALLGAALLAGWGAAHVAASLRYQAAAALQREERSRALYEFARELSGVLQTEQVYDTTCQFVRRLFGADATLLLPDDAGRLRYPERGEGASRVPVMTLVDMAAAQWAFDHAAAAGAATATVPTNSFFYLPLVAPMRTRGVMMIWAERRNWLLVPDQRELLEAFAALAAIALERVHYVEVAQDAVVHMESERLRNSLLAALSHDLRTPLTSLVGMSESLLLSRPALHSTQAELARALSGEARRLGTMVSNLLEMARIQSGAVQLNLQWQPIEEVIGSALRACAAPLAGRQVSTSLPASLPLVRFDATLIERVLCNLLENASKYAPPDAHIEIAAAVRDGRFEVEVHDNGPGLPPGREDALFEKFTRGARESAIPGVGLGLAICRAIVEAHGGSIHARNEQGAVFTFGLPLGEPPALPEAL